MKVFFPLTVVILTLAIPGLSNAASFDTVTIAATVLSKNQCKFNTAASTLNFGNLDPSNPIDVSSSTTFSFKCVGADNPATFAITDDDGLYETGPDANRMRHAVIATAHLPYGITLSPASGTVPRNVNQTLTVAGTINGADYQAAYAGSYSDTVIISIEP